jgi:hypothetical protein
VQVDDQWAGQAVACPLCAGTFAIPGGPLSPTELPPSFPPVTFKSPPAFENPSIQVAMQPIVVTPPGHAPPNITPLETAPRTNPKRSSERPVKRPEKKRSPKERAARRLVRNLVLWSVCLVLLLLVFIVLTRLSSHGL